MNHVIETMLPDGPHWYSGIRTHVKDGKVIQGPEWSPYWEDRKAFNREQAFVTFETVCKSMEGANIIEEKYAKKADTWKVVDLQLGYYSIRAKYLSVGMIVIPSGYISRYEVLKKTDKAITLGAKKGASGTIEFGANSDKRVTVVGKNKREVAQ